ncbi:hypothetical protein HYU50_03415 [Candidatus Woesearchaeota archaeon]|nr:hypothetical protein [Candidatus Woesearchaeota archaeon]
MAIQYKPRGLESKMGERRDIKLKSVISASLSKEPGSILSIDNSYLPPSRKEYTRFFTILEMPNILGIKSRDLIIDFEYRQTPKRNGQVQPQYTEGNMEIKLGQIYQLPEWVDGINKKLVIGGENLKS